MLDRVIHVHHYSLRGNPHSPSTQCPSHFFPPLNNRLKYSSIALNQNGRLLGVRAIDLSYLATSLWQY